MNPSPKHKMVTSRRWAWLLVLFLSLFHGVFLALFLIQDDLPPERESLEYFRQSLSLGKNPAGLFSLRPPFPVLSLILTAPLYRLFGPSLDTAALLNVLFLPMLLVCVFLLAETLAGLRAGAYTALVCSFLPGIYGFSRTFSTEIAFAAWLSLAMYCLVRSDGFRRAGWAVAFGLVAAACFLTRVASLLYLAVPVTASLLVGFRTTPRGGRREIAMQFGMALVTSAVVLAPWFLPAAKSLWSTYAALGFSAHFRDFPLWSWENLIFYPRALWNLHLEPPLAMIFLLALAHLGVRWDRRMLQPIVWLACTWLLLLLAAVKVERLLVPLLPVVAVVMGRALAEIAERLPRSAVLAAAGLLLGGQFLHVHSGISPARSWAATDESSLIREWNRYDQGAFRACPGGWRSGDLLRAMVADRSRRGTAGGSFRVTVPQASTEPLLRELSYETIRWSLPVSIETPWFPILFTRGTLEPSQEEIRRALQEAHYVLECDLEAPPFPLSDRLKAALARIDEIWAEERSGFDFVERFELPHGFELSLLRNRRVPPPRFGR